MSTDPGSFRDPAGVVVHAEGRVYRVVSPAGAAQYELARDSGLLPTLVALGLLIGFARREPEAARALAQRRRQRSAGLTAGRLRRPS